MRINKVITIMFFLSLLFIPMVSSGVVDEALKMDNVWDTIKNIFIGSFWKDSGNAEAAVRIMFFIFVFAVVWAVFNKLGGTPSLSWMGGRISVVLALIIAAMGTIFVPGHLLTMITEDYVTLAVLIFALPIMGLFFYGAYHFWGTNKWVAAIFILILIFMVDYVMGAVMTMDSAIKALPLIFILPKLRKKWD